MNLKRLAHKSITSPGYVVSRARGRLTSMIDGFPWVPRLVPSEEIVNDKEIRVFGMRRTGNHAIINWIEKQGAGAVHLNNLRLQENPYQCLYRIFAGKAHREEEWMARATARYPQYQGAEGLERLRLEAQGVFTKKPCLVLSYEDFPIALAGKPALERKHDWYVGRSAQRVDIIILRDPYNLMASRLQQNMLDVKSLSNNLPRMWIAYAKEFLGETNYLGERKLPINYNDWATDKAAREQIAAQLGLSFTDQGVNEVPRFGGGSSFNARDFDGGATKMDILNRWRHFTGDPRYRKLVANEELAHYSERIFGKIAGTEELRAR